MDSCYGLSSWRVGSFTLSSEVASAFLIASVAYAAYLSVTEGRAWLIAVVAPVVAAAGRLLLVGRDYLLMMKLFAQGINNFVVEPLPHVLIFLIALVWLVPLALAIFFRRRHSLAPMLGTLYIFSLGLLPAAFGSSDPGHVFFNGLMIFFLSVVAISFYRLRQQAVWMACLGGLFLWQSYLTIPLWRHQWQPAIQLGLFHGWLDGKKEALEVLAHTGSLKAAERSLSVVPEGHTFDIKELHSLVGNVPVATPLEVPLYVEDALKRSGQYTPSYYCFMFIYDVTSEQRVIHELNESQWALLPKGPHLRFGESPADTAFAMGIQITYPTRRAAYIVGERFDQNLTDHWQRYGEVGAFDVYRRR